MSAVDALILALADGRTMREAAAIARIPSAQAVRQARDVGWPDLDAIRLAAEEIRDRHTPPLSREETPVQPRKPEPIPIEPDVEQAITAALIREARASVALDRDETQSLDNWETSDRGIPDDLDAVVDHTDQHERPHVASVEAIDRELIDDTTEVLQLVDRLAGPTDRATLTMALARLIDIDGTETVLAVVEVDVQLNVPGVLEALAGKLFIGEQGGHVVIPTRIERHLTPQGRAALRELLPLLDEDGGDQG